MKTCFLSLLFVFFLFFCSLQAKEETLITLDLKEPVLIDGVLSTTKGGVLFAPGFYLQGKKISYTHKKQEGKNCCFIEAEGSLFVECKGSVFIAEKLFYDFEKEEGILYSARGGKEPWFFGASQIHLLPNGSYRFYNAYFTTSESVDAEWKITAKEAFLTKNKNLSTKKVNLCLGNVPVFWIPRLRLNLCSWFDSPIKYRVSFGGTQGTRVGFTYEVFSWNHWKTFFRLDYSLKRGIGGGIETHYHSSDYQTEIHTINYAARDSAPSNPSEKTRFRFQGLIHTKCFSDKFTLDMSWDKISDRDMPSDYYDKGIDIKTAEPTELILKWQEKYWISSIQAIARFNNFQTINQELPTLFASFLPVVLGKTGVIMQNTILWSFLDFKYANQLCNVSDYSSTRFEYRPCLYRPLPLGPFTLTPSFGGVFIHYGNGPEDHYSWVILAKTGGEIFTEFFKFYQNIKHVVQPYIDYRYLTFPTTSPDDHFIFDISDGWYRLNQLSFGIRNVFLGKNALMGLQRLFTLDVYTYAFFDTPTIPKTFPKIYAEFTFQGFPTLRHIAKAAWNTTVNQLDHINLRTDWTINQNAALSVEYRHRGSYDWRKAETTNFILESFRNQRQLRKSALSDRRDTLLLHLFYRFQPMWSLEFKMRHGWNRLTEPTYSEYEIDLRTIIRSCWHVRLSYQHREDEKRFGLYISVKLEAPEYVRRCDKPACFE